ncbi:hypothetical protein BDN72DRAFT_487298 [Pluteus cervinus]|uniref:Uncharacterized protein n=1 Tax=Pluteus cervinus TaxID=181527 RepID=A0ACD3B0A7_9AGAR|nr:hypothetical protein BDN72DRAFT_487298 [Pluteus cervinus]
MVDVVRWLIRESSLPETRNCGLLLPPHILNFGRHIWGHVPQTLICAVMVCGFACRGCLCACFIFFVLSFSFLFSLWTFIRFVATSMSFFTPVPPFILVHFSFSICPPVHYLWYCFIFLLGLQIFYCHSGLPIFYILYLYLFTYPPPPRSSSSAHSAHLPTTSTICHVALCCSPRFVF